MQTHTFTWSKMESYSADQQPANLKVSVTLHVAGDKVPEMYSRFRGDQQAAIDRTIAPHVNEKVKVVFGQYTAARAISARGQLNADAAKALTEAVAYDPVFVIESVQIEDISFSSEYIKSVEQRMQAEVEVQRLQTEPGARKGAGRDRRDAGQGQGRCGPRRRAGAIGLHPFPWRSRSALRSGRAERRGRRHSGARRRRGDRDPRQGRGARAEPRSISR